MIHVHGIKAEQVREGVKNTSHGNSGRIFLPSEALLGDFVPWMPSHRGLKLDFWNILMQHLFPIYFFRDILMQHLFQIYLQLIGKLLALRRLNESHVKVK